MNITSTYFHTFSLSRISGTTDEWGKEVEGYQPVETLQGQSCAYSQFSRRRKNQTQTSDVDKINYTNKIFCDPILDIKAGDRLTVFLGAKKIGEFTASVPAYYSTHQEVSLTREDEA